MNEPTATKSKQPTCRATRLDGTPCRAVGTLDGYCFAHAPELEERRLAARQKGGHNRAQVVRLRGLVPPRLLPIFDALERALQEVHDGLLSPAQASAMAAVARAMVAVLTAGELEERLRKLEEASEVSR